MCMCSGGSSSVKNIKQSQRKTVSQQCRRICHCETSVLATPWVFCIWFLKCIFFFFFKCPTFLVQFSEHFPVFLKSVLGTTSCIIICDYKLWLFIQIIQCTHHFPSACLGSEVDLMGSQHVNSQLFFSLHFFIHLLSVYPFNGAI